MNINGHNVLLFQELKTPFLFLQEMGFNFLWAIGQPSGLMDIRAGRIYEGMIPEWKELSIIYLKGSFQIED